MAFVPLTDSKKEIFGQEQKQPLFCLFSLRSFVSRSPRAVT